MNQNQNPNQSLIPIVNANLTSLATSIVASQNDDDELYDIIFKQFLGKKLRDDLNFTEHNEYKSKIINKILSEFTTSNRFIPLTTKLYDNHIFKKTEILKDMQMENYDQDQNNTTLLKIIEIWNICINQLQDAQFIDMRSVFIDLIRRFYDSFDNLYAKSFAMKGELYDI